MKNFKRFLAVVLVLAMAVLAVACNQTTVNPTPSGSGTTVTPSGTPGISGTLPSASQTVPSGNSQTAIPTAPSQSATLPSATIPSTSETMVTPSDTLGISGTLPSTSETLPSESIDSDTAPSTESTPSATTPEPTDSSDTVQTLKFAVVGPDLIRNGKNLSDALSHLRAGIQATYGVKVKASSDTGFTINASTYTFLVGQTALPQSSQVGSGMKLNDYGYKVLSDKLVVINGGSSAAVKKAVEKFCSDVMKYTASSSTPAGAPDFTVGTEYFYTGKYDTKTVTINGFPISDFKISVASKDHIPAAEKLASELGKHNGFSVPIVSYQSLKGTEKGVICPGSLDRKGTLLSGLYGGYRILVSTKSSTYTVGIAGSNTSFYAEALSAFESKIKTDVNGSTVTITLPEETSCEYTYELTPSISPEWIKDESKTVSEKLAEGLSYREFHYKDSNGNPYIANILIIDPSLYSFRLGTPSYSASATFAGGQSLTGQMSACANAGYDVVAGVNGDRWEWGNSRMYTRGMMLRDGELLTSGAYALPYFALTKDGEYVIGLNGQAANANDLEMAIGGDILLINKGVPQTYGTGDPHTASKHPRTLVGIDDNGMLILVTVDGRQPSYSNGATMEHLTDLMMSLGAYMAVSLDGGGSTTMAVKSGNSYTVKNNPSDGSQRTVVNSLLIVKK